MAALPASYLFSAIRYEFGKDSFYVEFTCIILQWVGMTVGNLLFIYELTHFSKFTQRYIGTSLALMQLYFTGKLFYTGGGGIAFKCFLVLLPFTWIIFDYILRKCSDTNITGRNIGKMKYKEIKKIFTTGYYDNKRKHYTKDEVYIRVGIVKEHMGTCKKL